MNISDLADNVLGRDYQNIMGAGPASDRLYGILGHESHTEPLAATIFWQMFVASPAYSQVLQKAGATPAAITHGENFIVQHSGRYDLVVLDPQYMGFTSNAYSVSMTTEDIESSWLYSLKDLYRNSISENQIQNEVYKNSIDIALEVSMISNLRLMIVRSPEILYSARLPDEALIVRGDPPNLER